MSETGGMFVIQFASRRSLDALRIMAVVRDRYKFYVRILHGQSGNTGVITNGSIAQMRSHVIHV